MEENTIQEQYELEFALGQQEYNYQDDLKYLENKIQKLQKLLKILKDQRHLLQQNTDRKELCLRHCLLLKDC